VKKDATELVGAVAKVIAEYTVTGCIHDVISALHPPEGYADFISAQYASTPREAAAGGERGDAEESAKIQELEALVAKRSSDIYALVADSEAKEGEIQQLKGKLQSAEAAEAKSATEIETLKTKINELTKDNYYSTAEVTKLTQQLEEQKSRVAVDSELTVRAHESEKELSDMQMKLHGLEAAAQTNILTIKALETELTEKKALIAKMNATNIQNNKEKEAHFQSQETTITHLRKLVSDLKGTKDELESQLNELKEDPTLNAKIEKLQAITRGFNARARAKRTKMHKDAQTSGVLVATKHTTQGESGWYCAPDGSLYYFVLDADEWILTCGPITREAFEETIQNLKPKKVSSAGYLKVSDFDLVTQTVDQPGDLYMSTSTWKLYFAVSVDHLVTENR
jgi:predicted RNase H-like nuclease (RuvC/YqgF family)